MLRQTVRFNTFETNSSSTHSCVICTPEEYSAWEQGKLYIDYDGNFYTIEELKAEYETAEDNGRYDDFEEWAEENEYYSFDYWNGDLETDYKSRIINGQEIVVYCKFGYDG